MGFDSMAAWDKSQFDFSDDLQKRGQRWQGTMTFSSPQGRSISRDDYSPPPPPFRAATASWSPPPSPKSSSPRSYSPKKSASSRSPPMSPCELGARSAPAVRSPTSPPLSPKDRHDLAAKLYDACCLGDLDLISLLISLGAPVNGVIVVPDLYESFKPAKPGRLSPLAGAATFNHLSAAQLLLDHGAILNPDVNQSSSSPLHQACRGDHIEMVSFLLEAGADVEGQNCYKSTPLMYAVKYASPETTSLVLSYQPELEAESFLSSTALFWGVWPGKSRNVELCLQAGANVSARMADGSTPLHCAAMAGWTEMAEVLLRYGANPLDKNDDWTTPVDVAKDNEHFETARLIKRFAIEGGL